MVPFPKEHHFLSFSFRREEGCTHIGTCGGAGGGVGGRGARRKQGREQSVLALPGLRMSRSDEASVCGVLHILLIREASVPPLLLTLGSKQPHLQTQRGSFRGEHMESFYAAKAELTFQTI